MTLFPEWQAAHKPQKVYPNQIMSMWKAFGKMDDKKCGDCKHLRVKSMGATYFKCDLSKITNGPGSDWRKGWIACGKFEE